MDFTSYRLVLSLSKATHLKENEPDRIINASPRLDTCASKLEYRISDTQDIAELIQIIQLKPD